MSFPSPTTGLACLCLCLLLAVPVVQAAVADGEDERAAQAAEDEQNFPISRRQASEIVRERYQGRILNIRLESGSWRLRLDNDGVVFNVLVDARSGEISIPEE